MLEAPDGRVRVRLPGRWPRRSLRIALPDGRRLTLNGRGEGWRDALAARTGRLADTDPWIAVLEEHLAAAPPARGAEPAPDIDARLEDIRRRAPGCHVDGPRAHSSGGWYMFVGGLPGGAWVMDYGDSPEVAAWRTLGRVEALLET